MNWLLIKIAIFFAILGIWNHHIQDVNAAAERNLCQERALADTQIIDDAGESWTCESEDLEAWICEDSETGEAWTCDGDTDLSDSRILVADADDMVRLI